MFPDGTVLNYLFWMATGAMLVLIWQSLTIWLEEIGSSVRWWQQALLFGCFCSFAVTVFAGFTLKGEHEGNAGWYMIGLFGTLHVIAAIALLRLFVLNKSRRNSGRA